jgi:hypothetical protein
MSSVINVFDLDFPWQTQDPFLFHAYADSSGLTYTICTRLY